MSRSTVQPIHTSKKVLGYGFSNLYCWWDWWAFDIWNWREKLECRLPTSISVSSWLFLVFQGESFFRWGSLRFIFRFERRKMEQIFIRLYLSSKRHTCLHCSEPSWSKQPHYYALAVRLWPYRRCCIRLTGKKKKNPLVQHLFPSLFIHKVFSQLWVCFFFLQLKKLLLDILVWFVELMNLAW